MAWPTKEQKEARERMASETSAPSLDMKALASLIQDATIQAVAPIRNEIAALTARIEKQEDATPRFTPMEAPEDIAAARREAIGNAPMGESEGTSSYPVTSTGERVDMRFMQPRFKAGERVRINASTAREGFPRTGDPFPDKWEVDTHGKKRVTSDWRKWASFFPDQPESGGEFPRDVIWGDILARQRSQGKGTIRYRKFLSKRGIWKYSVRVNGLTTKDGDGFMETELERSA